MDSEQFFLKWNNFESNLASGFADLLQKEAMVDVTLAAEGKILQAHKIILSICSSYFKNMFQVNPCQHPIVILKDVRYQELADMLDFMYKGEANVRQEDLPSFLKLAETLKVKGLAGNQGENHFQCNETSRSRNFESQVSNLTKEHSSSAKEDPSNDFILRDTMVRKKAKRCTSPLTYPETRDSAHSPDSKSEVERCDSNLVKNIVDSSCRNVIMKEERLSDNSLDSYEENHVPESLDVDKNLAGPSAGEDNPELVPQGWRQTKDYCFMKSCFGGNLLILKGYIYRRKSVISGRSYWNCCSPKCFAKGILLSDGEFKVTNAQHNHKPDFENLKRKEKLLELKKLALEVNAPGQNLLEALQIKKDIEKHLGLVRTWRRRNRKRSRSLFSAEHPLGAAVEYKLLPSRSPSKQVLFHSGYYFRQDSVNPLNKKCKYWRCKVKSCKARAKTDHLGNLTILNSVHNHGLGENEETSTHSEEMFHAQPSVLQEPEACEGTSECSSSTRSDAPRKYSWKTKRESLLHKLEKARVGADSVPVIEETDSPFCPPDNFSFDKLIAETLDDNYCVTNEFSESLHLLKNE